MARDGGSDRALVLWVNNVWYTAPNPVATPLFIYTDEANLKHDNVMQLMYLAKKYMLPSLADRCSAYLEKNLDASNASCGTHRNTKRKICWITAGK